MKNYSVQKLALFLTFLLVVYVGVTYSVPFSFNVDVHDLTYHDMCVGDQKQLVTATRSVFPPYGIPAHTQGELFKYVNDIKLETIIKRDVSFVYQPEDMLITYEIEWNRPVTEPGEYGASDLVTIYPYPLIVKTKYFSENDQRFEVLDCDI